jgi:hypothetical protein
MYYYTLVLLVLLEQLVLLVLLVSLILLVLLVLPTVRIQIQEVGCFRPKSPKDPNGLLACIYRAHGTSHFVP